MVNQDPHPGAEFNATPLPVGEGRTTLPTGTVTFLFTDIQGSTPLWEREPEKMAEALHIHNTALRTAIQAHGGVVFKIVGDAFQAAFPRAQPALKAAIAGQHALAAAPWNELGELKVRMGLHTGEAEVDPAGDEYAVSHTKNRVARIMSAASGGQVLLSQETKDLVERQLPEGVRLKDLGEQRLKGMEWLEHIYQVCAPGLPTEFPPLATGITHPNNLPVQVTSFIGREKEISMVSRLLGSYRLVTLTGSGGTGKTRLSLEIAHRMLESYPNGAWLVELAPLADPELILKTVTAALNLPEIPGKTTRQALEDFLHPKTLLLILDNCEHLLEACADLADWLIRACPNLSILASSREFLGVEGEMPYRVPPLGLPDVRHLPALNTLAEYDAVRLFVERARVASPEFELQPTNAAAVAQVVSRLDGIPLAIELAASRMRLLGVEQLAQRLNDAFRLLTGGSRSKLPRHQTLRACIDWSYYLLSEPERILLRRLSVFAGGWSLQAAEAVCAGGTIQPHDILDLLTELLDKSLIHTAAVTFNRNRYNMLETIRQYAHEKLVDEKEAESVRSRHMAYYVNLAEELEPRYRSRFQIESLEQTEVELDNFRLALEWGLQADILAELHIAADLVWFWHIRSHWSEGIDWLEQGLEAEKNFLAAEPATDKQVIRARALTGASFLFLMLRGNGEFKTGMNEKTLRYQEESLALLSAADAGAETQRWLGWAKLWLGSHWLWNEDQNQGKSLTLEALELFRGVGDAHGTAECLLALANMENDLDARMKWNLEQLAVEEANGDVEGIATALLSIGWVSQMDCLYGEARFSFEKSLQHYENVKNTNMVAVTLLGLSHAALAGGNLTLARQSVERAIALHRELGIGIGYFYFWYLWSLSFLEVLEGRFTLAEEINERIWSEAQGGNFAVPIAGVYHARAWMARLCGDLPAAQKWAEAGLPYGADDNLISGLLLREIGLQHVERGSLAEARRHWRDSLKALQKKGRLDFSLTLIDTLAMLARLEGKLEKAATLFGCRWSRGYFYFLAPQEQLQRQADLDALRTTLGETRFTELYEAGRSLSRAQAVALALEGTDE